MLHVASALVWSGTCSAYGARSSRSRMDAGAGLDLTSVSPTQTMGSAPHHSSGPTTHADEFDPPPHTDTSHA